MENIFQNINLGDYQEIELELSISAFEAFKRLYPHTENLFLLESLGDDPDSIGVGGKYNRFSYVGFTPMLLLTASNKDLIVNNRVMKSNNPFSLLKTFVKFKSKGRDFCGGLVGYFSYEATAYMEKSFAGFNSTEFPDFQFGLYLDGLKFDRKGQKCIYFHYGNSRLPKLIKTLRKENGNLDRFDYKTLKEPQQDEHRAKVKNALDEIKKGNIFQVVSSERTDYQIKGDTRRIYANLRQINPSPYMIYLKNGKREIISASPELLIRTNGLNLEHFGTLAGTSKRGEDQAADSMLKELLLKNEKELAEHYMLVDLARNDVGRVSQFGSITVDKLATVKKFSKVQHLYSEIRGTLQDDKNSFDALAACFPAGTLTGAPKVEAMKIIKRLEGKARGPYGGVAGYFSLNQDSMFAIIIRSLFISGNAAYTQTGSGIVLDSNAEDEFNEIAYKQRGMKEALERAIK